MVGLFFIGFFGLALSIVGLAVWGTFVPLIVTVVLLVLLITIHILLKKRMERMP
jgi:hypothetical protein